MPVQPAAAPVPPALYKRFEIEAHARAFIERGRLRFSSLEYYRSQADPPRRDHGEGRPDNGNGHGHGLGDRPSLDAARCMICSLATPDSALARPHADARRFGAWCVRIDDPARLLAELAEALASQPQLQPWGGLHHGWVHYSDAPDARAGDAWQRAWLSKPAAHRQEQEFRLMFEWPAQAAPSSHYHVDLDRRLPYLQLLADA